MTIKHLINKEEAWEDFYNFCSKSKPYASFCNGSKLLRDSMIRSCFCDFIEICEIYFIEDDEGKIGYCFVSEKQNYNHIVFLFGIKKSSSFLKMIQGLHKILEKIQEKNNKYFVSEIRRSFKVNIYKKWIEKYEKRAIILNNEDETVLWYNSEDMKGKLTIIGANDVTKYLLNQEAYYESLFIDKSVSISQLKINDQTFLFDAKNVEFLEDSAIINGMISDDSGFAGNVTLLFKP